MKTLINFNNDWEFSPSFDKKMLLPKYKGEFKTVRIPHSVVETPYNNFSESSYQLESIYRKTFKTESSWLGKRILLKCEGIAHQAEIFLNGKSIFTHNCGYTAFSVDLTDYLNSKEKENLLCIRVDSRENLNIPPFGNVIDYMTYGGIYREVFLEVKNSIYINDVYVKTKSNHLESEITLNTEEDIEGYTIQQRVINAYGADVEPSAIMNTGISGRKVLTSAEVQPVVAWSLENPVLYNLVTELYNPKGKLVDSHVFRFGFRDIKFDESGFYLNNKKIKLRGMNRHQSYPYVGYAMPKNIQKDDADILKYELGLNFVRTSHYPQSQHFIDRCDELGILVFTEIPGWQHIGNTSWKKQALENVREMIVQYRNHPSIIMWGVRINESQDDDELYLKTNELAHDLDSTRFTAGVRYIKNSNLLEDIYTYNDFNFNGSNEATVKKSTVTESNKAYMITEYNGHMYPTKSFDTESHRTEHALRHAKVLDSVSGDDEIAGSSAWCAFDYNTHQDFGSGDRICYHGVMDMFRNPKLASSVYRSQMERELVGDVLEINTSFDIGEYPAGNLEDIWIFTNADSVKYYENNILIRELFKEDSPFKNLKHGPLYLDDRIGNRLITEENIKEKYENTVKEIFADIKKYGQDNLPFATKFNLFKLKFFKVASFEKIMELYYKYYACWGGKRKSFKFEAYKNGKLVKTVNKTCGKEYKLSYNVLRSELIEDTTYDVSEVRISCVDEFENIQTFCQEAISVSVDGAIELIGPSAVSLKGGMCGVYVKSKGKTGKGNLIIKDWMNNLIKIPFTVKIQK